MLAFRHYQLFAERNCICAAPPEAMMQIPQLHKRMPDTLPKDWRLLPTGYFTHQLVGLPNPLDDAPESPDRIEAIEARLMLAGLEGRVRRVECGPAPREAVLLAHDSQYVDDLEHASLGDPEALKRFTEPDTRVGEDTFSCAMASAGAVVRAVDAIYGRSVKMPSAPFGRPDTTRPAAARAVLLPQQCGHRRALGAKALASRARDGA